MKLEIGGVPKIGGLCLGVPIMRVLVSWVCIGVPYSEKLPYPG